MTLPRVPHIKPTRSFNRCLPLSRQRSTAISFGRSFKLAFWSLSLPHQQYRIAKMSMNFVTFNQDFSHLAVGKEPFLTLCNNRAADRYDCYDIGTSRGFRIYTTDPFSKCFESKEGDITLLEMLFSTSLVALILSPRRLQITNTKVRRFN